MPNRCSAFRPQLIVPLINVGDYSDFGGRQIPSKFNQEMASPLNPDMKTLSEKIIFNVMLFVNEGA